MDHEDARSQFYVVVATIAADQISTQICNPGESALFTLGLCPAVKVTQE